MADPKPIKLTQVSEGAYTGPHEPKPYVLVGTLPVASLGLDAALKGLPGYDAAEEQTLNNVSGVLTWVTVP